MLSFPDKEEKLILDKIKKVFTCKTFDVIMPYITALGNGGAIWLFFSAGMLATKKYRNAGFVLIVGITLGAVLGNVILKNLFKRSRPCWGQNPPKLLIKNPQDYAFPSGHTLSSFLAALILSMVNFSFIYFCVPLAALIAFSRLYLYVHYPSDIFFGALLGLMIGYGVYAIAAHYALV